MTYEILQEGIKCLFCNKISSNKNDISEKYCGFCKKFHGPIIPVPVESRPTVFDRFFLDSPSVGDPDCKCSHCAKIIEKGPAIRLWQNDLEYRYHLQCLGLEADEYDDDDF